MSERTYAPLHPKIGPQILHLEPITPEHEPKVFDSGKVMLAVSRKTLEELWTILNDLQTVAYGGDQKPVSEDVAKLREALAEILRHDDVSFGPIARSEGVLSRARAALGSQGKSEGLAP